MARQCRGFILALCGLLAASGPAEGAILLQRRQQQGPTYVVGSGDSSSLPVAVNAAKPSVPKPATQKVKPSVCAGVNSCSRCTALAECGWCGVDQKCVDGTKLGPRTEQCLAYGFMQCSNVACADRGSCSDCLVDSGCGWCGATNTCTLGDGKGPFTASTCPASAGFTGKRHLWAHGASAQKCEDAPAPHSSKLWSGLRKLMYKSQQRAAKMNADMLLPDPVVVAAPPTPAPVYVMTSWILPATTTVATTTVATTTTITTTTTTTTTTITTTTLPPKPPIRIDIDVNQDVANNAKAAQPQHKTVEVQAAPAAPKAKVKSTSLGGAGDTTVLEEAAAAKDKKKADAEQSQEDEKTALEEEMDAGSAALR